MGRISIPKHRLTANICSAASSVCRSLEATTVKPRSFIVVASVLLLAWCTMGILLGETSCIHPWPIVASIAAITYFGLEGHLPKNALSLCVAVFAPFAADHYFLAAELKIVDTVLQLMLRAGAVAGVVGVLLGALSSRVDPEIVLSERWLLRSAAKALGSGLTGAALAACVAFSIAMPITMIEHSTSGKNVPMARLSQTQEACFEASGDNLYANTGTYQERTVL